MRFELPIRVINLDRSTDRLALITKQFDAVGLEWERVPAIAPTHDQAMTHPLYDRARARSFSGRDLSPSEVGCFLSHISALRCFIESSDPVGLVLEDDVLLCPNLPERINEIINFLEKSPYGEWHCINLSSSYQKRRRRVGRFDGFDLYRSYYFPLRTSALLWSKVGAKALLDSVKANGIYAPVDNQLRDFLTRRGVGLFAEPCLVGLAPVESTIRERVPHHDRVIRWKPHDFRQKFPLYLAAFMRQMMGE